MFWFAVTVATLFVLAWREVRLAHATGVLGILLLFYGWLGESGGRFLLLLIAYLAVFVPLNARSLRQEWLTRPLLDRLLEQLPRFSSAHPAAAAFLLEGSATELSPQAQPASALEQEALDALLQARLRTPLQAAQPGAATGQLASALYAAAAARAYGVEALAPAQAPLARQLACQHAWALAQIQVALTGQAPAALQQLAFACNNSWLPQTLLGAHRPWRAVLEAAHEPHPYTRLIAFDTALFHWLRQAITQGVKTLVNGLTLGALLPLAHLDEDARPAHRAAMLSQGRLAVLANLWLANRAFAQSPSAIALRLATEAPISSALLAQLQLQTLLQWPASAKAPNLEAPLLAAARQQAALAAETAQWQALDAIAQPLQRWLLKTLLFPLGRRASAATLPQLQEASRAFFQHAEVRARLLPEPCPPELAGRLTRIDALARMQGPLTQLAAAHFEPAPATPEARVALALKMGFVDAAQHAELVEALAFAETLNVVPSESAVPAESTPLSP